MFYFIFIKFLFFYFYVLIFVSFHLCLFASLVVKGVDVFNSQVNLPLVYLFIIERVLSWVSSHKDQKGHP